ncbi:hypothetical protein L596_024020 [Steinernema carpocapsae]|uniref:G-protein coupled receptors family 1 profile domain-containing protein n=1 Tax=Steinernema carpocapsae TaxID=34508 RepID=A0A4U5MFN5_STECR|nr:hypothetical protein L596_024020 [Steinernema carpocapsae]
MVLPIRMILVASGAVQNETASGEIDGGCLNVGKIIRSKRHYDLTFSTVGFIFSTLHLIVLLYVRFVKKKKGFELLFTQACLSFLSLLFLVIGCLADLCVFEDSKSLIFFRGHIWLFMVNSLIAAYSFLIIVLCIDRHVALTRPLYYRVQFVRYRIRFGMISGAIILAMVCAVKWFFFNEVLENGVRENRNVRETSKRWKPCFSGHWGRILHYPPVSQRDFPVLYLRIGYDFAKHLQHSATSGAAKGARERVENVGEGEEPVDSEPPDDR